MTNQSTNSDLVIKIAQEALDILDYTVIADGNLGMNYIQYNNIKPDSKAQFQFWSYDCHIGIDYISTEHSLFMSPDHFILFKTSAGSGEMQLLNVEDAEYNIHDEASLFNAALIINVYDLNVSAFKLVQKLREQLFTPEGGCAYNGFRFC